MFEAEVNPSGIDQADLVVSIPSHNEANTIGHEALQAGDGLTRYFPGLRAVVINSDNKSPDHTKEDCMVFEMTKPYLVQRWLGKPSDQ